MRRGRTHLDYLQDILDATAKALQFTAGVDSEAFRANDEKSFAVVRALEIIGEAVRHVPPAVRARYPEVPWEDLIGTRNVLIHGYFGVDLDVVWRTVIEDLPPLQEAVQRILRDALKNG